MGKRRLNRQQLRRISSNQRERGKKASLAARQPDERFDNEELGPETEGIVVCHFGQQLEIESLAEESRGAHFRCFQRSNLPPLVTGDRVIWQPGHDHSGVVVALEPRRSELNRPNAQGTLRAIASNIDQVIIVIAPSPSPFANLIDRYLVAVENLDLQPVILLNKSDLLQEGGQNHHDGASDIHDLLALYRRIGYPVLQASCENATGMEALREQLLGQTAVFVGQSGVGKSSLINALRARAGLDQADDATVGRLSAARDKGKHTTTATRLYHLPGSGDLIDSPGIREFGLWQLTPEQVMDGFIEFRLFLGHCRFRDCQHQQEPGCALRQALADGHITKQRLDNCFHIIHSLPSC